MQLKVHKNGGDLFRTADLWCRKQNALPTEPQHLAITSYTNYQIYCILFELKEMARYHVHTSFESNEK